MNPITNTRNQMKMNERELELGLSGTKSSWHMEYKDSAWVFIGGMPYELSEGDMVCMFSQYGEVVHVNLVRDHNTGKSRGFGFLCYEDQRSTNLAVDNLNAFKILSRLIRVDHVHKYKLPKDLEKLDDDKKALFLEGCAPKEVDIVQKSSSEELEPMEEETKKKKKKKKKSKKKKKKREKDSGDSDSSSSESETERKKKKKRKKREESDDESSSDSNNESRNRRINDSIKKEPSRANYETIGSSNYDRRRDKEFTNGRREDSDRNTKDRREDSDRNTNGRRDDTDRNTNDRRDDSGRQTKDRRDDMDRNTNGRREDSDRRTYDRRDDSERHASNRSDRHYDKDEHHDRKRERSRGRDRTQDYRSRK